MRQFSISLTFSLGLALVGCAAPISFSSVPETPSAQVKPEFEPGDLVLRLRIGDSRTLQAGGDPVLVYDVANVAYLVILPFVKEGEAFVPMSSAGKPTTEEAADRLKVTTTDRHQTYFVFKNLPPDQTYRFQARAYDAEHNLISEDAASTTDVTFTRVEYANTPTLQLKLKDKPFMGATKATVRFPDGLQGTDHVVVELFKKGPPEVMVGKAVRIEAADFSSARTVLLGGLAPDTTYVLKAEARGADGKALTSGSVEWAITNDRSIGEKEIALSFDVHVSTYVGPLGTFSQTALNGPWSLASDASGSLYVGDYSSNRLLKIAADGTSTTLVSGSRPRGIVIDDEGQLIVLQEYSTVLKKVNPVTGAETSFADIVSPGQALCRDAAGNLYVAHASSIRKITPQGVVSLLVDGSGQISGLEGIGSDGVGNVYVASYNDRKIYKVTPDGTLSHFAGTGGGGIQDGDALATATFNYPTGVAVSQDGSTVYVTQNYAVRAIKAGVVRTIAGGSTPETLDGLGTQARFEYPGHIVLRTDGDLLLADFSGKTIRLIHFP